MTPAAVIGQQLPDGRIQVLDEFVCDDSGIVRFATSLTAFMKQRYPDNPVAIAVGDPAGTARGPDERTCFEIMNQHTPWRWRPAATNDPTLRIESVSAALNRMVDGKPGFQLDPRVGVLRKGFAGGYCFARVQTKGDPTFHETPKKNAYSHPHDALQYLIVALGGADLVLNRDKRRTSGVRMADGIDFPLVGETVPEASGTGVRWGDPPYKMSNKPSGRKAIGTDFDVFS